MMVPPPVTPIPARLSRSCRVVRMMIDTGSPLSWPSCPLIRAMRPTAIRASCWRWARLRWSLSIWACDGVPRGAGFGIVGVAHPRCGVLGVDHLQHRPRFGGQVAAERDGSVGALSSGVETAGAVAFGVVGGGAVLVEQEQGQLGDVGEFFGSDADRGAHQVDLDLIPGPRVDETRQFGDRLADDLDVLGVDQPAGLGGGGRGQYRRQRLAGQRPSRSQQRGRGQSAVCFGGRDPPPDPEHVPPRFGTHLLRCRLGLQAGQDAVALGG